MDAAYLQRHASDSAVIGTSPARLIATLGPPDADQSFDTGERELTYRHGDAYLKVTFENGRATRTVRWLH